MIEREYVELAVVAESHTRVIPRAGHLSLTGVASGYDAEVEHRFTGPSYTIGVEEELMIVDQETLDLTSSIEGLLETLEDVPKEGEVKSELMESVCEIATDPCANTRDVGRSSARCGASSTRPPGSAGLRSARPARIRSRCGRTSAWCRSRATAT